MERRRFGTALTLGLAGGWRVAAAPPDAAGGLAPLEPDPGLTAVAGVKVGHFTDSRRPTGCSVVLVEAGAVCGVDVRGGAPGTRETDLLNPAMSVAQVHGVVLSGGSAFGLDAASGVVRYLEERGIGFAVGAARVPIVPAAILFDLQLGDGQIRPDAAAGYAAARAAGTGPVAEGSVGAGAGAVVGRLFGADRTTKGGVGGASLRIGELVVAAMVAVNAVGDVVGPDGRIVAGARTSDGRGFEGSLRALLAGTAGAEPRSGESTTLGVVATNARLTKAEATKVAQMAQDGIARAIVPAHTPWDGDTVFALALGTTPASVTTVGSAAAEAVARAIVRGVRSARGVLGIPGAAELSR